MSTPYRLPAGLLSKSGSLYRDVLLKPFTGRVHKEIAQKEVRTNPTRVLNTILSNCIEEIEGVGKPTQSVLREMLVGDRDFCALKIRQLTWDTPVRVRHQCSACEESSVLDINLDLIDIYELQERHYEIRESEEGDGKPVRVYKINDIPPNDEYAYFRFISGEDQDIISPLLTKNPIEAEFKMFSRTLVDWNGQGPNMPKDFFDDLSLDTTVYLAQEFSGAQPGPETAYGMLCPNCGVENSVSIYAGDFLFKSPTSRSRTRWMQ